MKMVVGLGNPGRKYRGTRHNVGFDVLGELHRRWGSPRASHKFDSEMVEGVLGGHKTLLLSPLTYMNLSGRAVRAAIDFFKLDVEEDLLVICDDFQLPLGRLRFRRDGSAGGQKGLQSVIQHLGQRPFARLRIGVGPVPAGWEASAFVLGKFNESERPEAEQAVLRASESVAVWATEGIDACMNQYNADPRAKGPDVSAGNVGSGRAEAAERPDRPRAGSGEEPEII